MIGALPGVIATRHAPASSLPGAHRYWRLYVSANNGSTQYVAVPELELYESVYGPNVVAGGTASASSTEGSWTADRAFDQSLSDPLNTSTSTWRSALNSIANQWIAYDFGSGVTKEILSIGLWGRVSTSIGENPMDFSVQYSDDGVSWSTAWSETGTSWSAREFKRFTHPDATVPTYSGSPHGTHTYWRVLVGEPSGSNASAFAEVEMRATPGGADQCAGGTASASTIFGASNSADKAFDNSATTFWASTLADKNGPWIRYQFGSAVTVAQVALTARNDSSFAQAIKIGGVQYSDNGTTWTTAWWINETTAWSAGLQRTYSDPLYV